MAEMRIANLASDFCSDHPVGKIVNSHDVCFLMLRVERWPATPRIEFHRGGKQQCGAANTAVFTARFSFGILQ